MKYFITGASGFIGGHLAERLVSQGHEVEALVRRSSNCTLLKNLGVSLVEGDLKEPGSFRNALHDVDGPFDILLLALDQQVTVTRDQPDVQAGA